MSDMAWVAVGDQENWEMGLENGIWGIRPELEHHWCVKSGEVWGRAAVSNQKGSRKS
jgi:hypothetical protein